MHKLLFFVIIIAVILRFYNLNWDEGYLSHPDERNIANAVSHIHFFDELDPNFFAYGGFPIYFARAAADFVARFTGNNTWVFDWGHINIITRFLSAAFSTLTIIPLYLLAKKVVSREAALLSIGFYTFTVSSIQAAHFGTVESMLVFMVVFLCFLSVRLINEPSTKSYIYCGIVLGLAIATKMTALSFIIIPLTAHILAPHKSHKRFFALLFSTLAVFTLFSPYTFLNWDKFIESMRYESAVATGALSVPYTLQFKNTTAYLYQIKNLFWQMGPAAFFIIPGIVFLAIKAVLEKNKIVIVFIIFPILYFVYVGLWQAKFIRYMLPIIPFLTIAISYFFILLKKEFLLLGRFLIALFLLITIFWAMSFFSIYTREQTRITASKWIYSNIPFESKILGEHWDDGLPLSISPFTEAKYKRELLTIYEPDNQNKINYYAVQLSTADYIIINSRRLYGTLMRLSDKYPVTSRYYALLFDNKLGYERMIEFTSYPVFFGITINDDASEETFQVFEHPKVIIFKNSKRFSDKIIAEKLQAL